MLKPNKIKKTVWAEMTNQEKKTHLNLIKQWEAEKALEIKKKKRSPEAAAIRVARRKAEREQKAAISAEKKAFKAALYADVQYYKNIPLQQVIRTYKSNEDVRIDMKARRFTLNHTNQNVWIPCKHLDEFGKLLPDQDIDYVFLQARNQCYYAGVTFRSAGAIIGKPIPNPNRRNLI